MQDFDLKHITEAIIFSSPEPVTLDVLRIVIGAKSAGFEPEPDALISVIDELNSDYEAGNHAFRIKQVAGGFSFATKEDFHPWLEHIQHENAFRKITQTALETLAIVAYRQPITKPEIDHIRGVDSGYVVRQLMEKGLIDISGRSESPGRPILYRTSSGFLRHFGLNGIDELPKPREIEEILQDDDMAKHRQLMFELKAEMQAQMDSNSDNA